jgi:hypothetical protein
VIVIAIAPVDVLAGIFVDGSGSTIREYTPAGALVRSIQVPFGGGDASEARGVTVDAAGRIHVFNGTFQPYLSTLDPATGTWTHRTHPGWNLDINNGSYGGIASLGNYVFAPDMGPTGTSNSTEGIIRFNIADNTSQRFAQGGFEFINVSMGQDGILYALGTGGATEGVRVRGYDPDTLALVRDVNLRGATVRGIVVDAAGAIYGGSWGSNVYKFGADGQILDTLQVGGNFSDIDLRRDGTIVVGDWTGSVVYTDTSLDRFTRVSAGTFDSEFVAFTDPSPVPEPSSFAIGVVVAGWVGLRRRR